MSRRRRQRGRRRPTGSNNKWLILVQIVVMAGVLIFLFLFWDYIAGGTGDAVGTLTGTGDDLKVQEAAEDPGTDDSSSDGE